MGIKQYAVGKKWEEDVMSYYKSLGYYVYKFPTELNGTICDILVVKNSVAMFIECKHTANNKLYYKSSGIFKKRDELDNFVSKHNTNIYIMITSDECGEYWTTWKHAKPIFEEQGYLDLERNCIKANMIYE